MKFLIHSLLSGLLLLFSTLVARAEVAAFTVRMDEGMLEFCDGSICIQPYPLDASEQHQYCSDKKLVATLVNDNTDGDIGEKSRFSTNEDILEDSDLTEAVADSIGRNVHLGWFICASINPSVGSVTVLCVDPDPVTQNPGPETYFTVCARAIMDSTTDSQ